MLVRRIARPLMSTIFIAGGIDALRNPAPRAKAATPLIEQGKETLPNSVTSSVPEDPETLVRINGAIQVGGGILLHGLEELGWHAPAEIGHGIQHAVEDMTGALSGILGWATYAAYSALAALGVGAVVAVVLHKVFKLGHDEGEGEGGGAH